MLSQPKLWGTPLRLGRWKELESAEATAGLRRPPGDISDWELVTWGKTGLPSKLPFKRLPPLLTHTFLCT